VLFLVLAGGDARLEGYGWLTRTFDGDARVVVAPILVLAGVLIGFGAKRAGGCTSGNGLSASSFGSPAGLVAMASFMTSAVAVSFAIEALR